MFQRMLLDYLREICDAGADLISFADPAGNPAILGPRFSSTLRTWFLYPFLEEALILCSGKNKSLMICPALAAGFEGEGVPPAGAGIRACCIGNTKRIEVDGC